MVVVRKNQMGFSLIELLISMGVGLALVAGVVNIMSSTVKSSSDFLALAKLDQDLQAIMDLMVKEVRRSGYDSNSSDGNDTAFYLTRSSSSCLLYSYDDVSNTNDGTLDNEERFGFRTNGSNIQFGQQATDCTSGTWSTINDSSIISIDSLAFAIDTLCVNLSDGSDCSSGGITPAVGDQYIEKYQVTINLTGTYNSTSTSKTVTATVRSHNDVIKTQS